MRCFASPQQRLSTLDVIYLRYTDMST